MAEDKMKLRDIRYWPIDIRCGLRNLWDYFPLIWRDRNWDWEYLAMLMEFKITRMANSTEKYGHHMRVAEDVKNMRLCAALLKRILDNEYPFVEGEIDYMMKQDEALLFKTMQKHWRCWWD